MSLGAFLPRDSVIHRASGSLKFLLFSLSVLILFMSKSFIVYSLMGVLLIGAVLLSKVGIMRFFRSLKPLLWFIVFIGIIQFFMVKEGAVLTHVLGFPLYDQTLVIIARVTLRLSILSGISILLTMTTSPIALAKGIETLCKPLGFIGFPVKDAALAFSIGLRFVPVFLGEFQRVSDARKARGFDGDSFIQKIRNVTTTMIPLLVSAVNHAEELGNALEIRGYSVQRETAQKAKKISK